MAKALEVKSVSRRDSKTNEVVVTLHDGTEFPLVLGDAAEFDTDGFPKNEGEGVFTSLKAWDGCAHDINVAGVTIGDARTPEGQARMFLLAAVKALAPHVARHRGFDPDAYTDRSVAEAAFELYHPLWPKVEKEAQLEMRAQMLGAVERIEQRRRDALAGKTVDLPENVVPHARVVEHYHGGWRRHRPHHADVAPTGIPFATNAKYAGIETIEELMGMLASRDHAQRMRYIFGAFPSLLRRFVPLHIRYQLLGASAHYTGPLRHALEPRTAKFAGPGTIIGLIEANARGVGGLLFGERNDAAALVVDLRRSTQAGIEFIGDALDRPAHQEQRIAGLAGAVLARGDPVRALAAHDRRSRDLYLVLAGLESELAGLPVEQRQQWLMELWAQQRAILAGRESLSDRKPATFQTDASRPSGAPSPVRMMVTRGAADVIGASAATLFALAMNHPVDVALVWSYAVGAVVNAGLFPLQQKALAKDRDAGAVQTALAAQREADIARFAVLSLLVGGKDVAVPPELAEYLKDFDNTELKPWTPHLRPFLIRRLLVAPFVIGTAATPFFFKQIWDLAWGNLASNATRLPVGALSSWLFFRKLVLRGQEFQRLTEEADRLATVPTDLARLSEENTSLTVEIGAQTKKQRAQRSISKMKNDSIIRKAIGGEAAAALEEQLIAAGNGVLIERLARAFSEMNSHQINRYCRQLVPEWDEVTSAERGSRIALAYTHQNEKDVLTFGAARLAWLNANEYLPQTFQFDELFASENVTPMNAEQLALFRTICSLPCASAPDGRRLAAVLHIALLKGGSKSLFGIWVSGRFVGSWCGSWPM